MPDASSIYFQKTLELAHTAFSKDEVPIGAVLVKDDQIISSAFNQTESRKSFTAHAEMLCIETATKLLESKYLNGCRLYVSLEPCLMCQYAARLSRIESIHYLITSEKYGSMGQAYPDIVIKRESSDEMSPSLSLLQSFFEKKR